MMMRRFIRCAVAGLMWVSASGWAGEPVTLGWKDLAVELKFDDPFAALTPGQLGELATIARVRELQATGEKPPSRSLLRQADVSRKSLEGAGIDVNDLLARREEIMRLRQKRGSALRQELNGKRIRMAGYALPLEHEGRNVTEFLLVPWVGACIHTPPPPPNQIVHVAIEKGFVVTGRFEPVWIVGTVVVGNLTKNLYLDDGAADIHIGYAVKAEKVERFTPNEAASDQLPVGGPEQNLGQWNPDAQKK